MEKKNNNGVIIGLLIGIIIMLLIFICLFATNTISFSNKTEDNSIKNVYIGYFSSSDISYSTTLVLFTNNKFNLCMRYECLYGKYNIDDNKLTLTTDSNNEYPTSIKYTYTFNSDKTELLSSNSNEYCNLKKFTSSNNNQVTEKNSQIDSTINNEDTKQDNRNEVIDKLKEVLTNESWIKENLYSKKNCFDKEVNVPNQELTFEVLSDNNNNPIVIVLDEARDDYIVTTYKVYYDNNEVKVKNIFDVVKHPSHGGFAVDVNKNLVISIFAHMGDYSFSAYDVTNDEPKLYDEYKCGNCEYEYKGEKTYNTTGIAKELTADNINKYLK